MRSMSITYLLLLVMLTGYGCTETSYQLSPSPKPPAQALTPSASEYFEQGKAHREKRELHTALESFSEAIQIDPDFADAFSWRGAVRYDLGDDLGALDDQNKAIELDPQLALAYSRRCSNLVRLSNLQQALNDCDTAIELDPSSRNYGNRGIARSKSQNYQGALADLNKSLELNPKNVISLTQRANTLFELGDYQNAIADCNQAINIDPTFALAFTVRGLNRANLGDTQGAIKDLEQAADIAYGQGDTVTYQEAVNLLPRLRQ